MNEQDIRSDSQKYLDEMMRFYSMNKNASVSTQENRAEEPAEEGETQLEQAPPESVALENETVQEDIADEELNEPEKTEPEQPENETISRRFPEPVIPEFIRKQSAEAAPPDMRGSAAPDHGKMPAEHTPDDGKLPYTDHGFLKVEARTGDNGLPVPNAAITVVRKNGKEEELVFSGVTDESGSVERIKLPAPPNLKTNAPESFQNYAVYTVSAYVKDFYREVSADVPVFAGVTSIQRFNLIPMPFNFDDNGRSITFENTEPII